MLQQRTKIKITDNSGATLCRCIKVLGGNKKKYAYFGQKVIASVRKTKKNRKNKIYTIKKGSVQEVFIIRTKKSYQFKDGSYIRFNSNSGCLINKDLPKSTRITGPTLKLLKNTKYSKIAVISQKAI